MGQGRMDVGAARDARPLGVSGGMPPQESLDFRPSKIVSGAILG